MTLSLKSLAEFLRASGYPVSKIVPPSVEADAEIILAEGWSVQVGGSYYALNEWISATVARAFPPIKKNPLALLKSMRAVGVPAAAIA